MRILRLVRRQALCHFDSGQTLRLQKSTKMNNFLLLVNSAVKNLGKYRNVYVVMGNESCDLDSAISALVYAFYLHSTHNTTDYKTPVIPVLNIQEDEFPLRTETNYFLKKLNIDTTKLICRDNINIKQLAEENKLNLVLVDHHVLPVQDKYLERCVIEVIDHRPKDESSNWSNISFIINSVGSCTTLVANILFDKLASVIDNTIAKLLHGTIVLDTINFNTMANRFTQLDVDITSRLENSFEINYSREEIFTELTSARSDVSSLTPFQILHRDMKVINGVPFPGVPMLVSDFLELPSAAESFKRFCETKKCKVIVPMGLVTTNNKVFREIGVYSVKDSELKNALVNHLKNNIELKLTELNNDVCGLTLFSQANVNASRKHIIPLLSPVIVDCKSGNNI